MSRSNVAETSIALNDVHGLMEACRGMPGPNLDIIIHSPGGSPEAAASIVHYLREKYAHIRVFVPLAAMSAATMWALAADRIVMGAHSQLGPIDPQFVISDRLSVRVVAASAILDQFKKAKDEIAADQATLGAWAQILPQYGPRVTPTMRNCYHAVEGTGPRLVEAVYVCGQRARRSMGGRSR